MAIWMETVVRARRCRQVVFWTFWGRGPGWGFLAQVLSLVLVVGVAVLLGLEVVHLAVRVPLGVGAVVVVGGRRCPMLLVVKARVLAVRPR